MAINISGPSASLMDAQSATLKSSQQLASGQRINSAADDAAGLIISTGMTSQLNGFAAAASNTVAAMSYTEMASGSLQTLTDNIGRMRELTVQAGNGILNDSDRNAIQQEINQLSEQNQSLLQDSNFNGQSLFSGNSSFSFQVGSNAGDTIQVSGSDLQSQLSDAGLFAVDVSNPAAAANSLASLDQGLDMIGSQQTDLGALNNRLQSTSNRLAQDYENTAAANSRIADADMAKAASDYTAGQIRDHIQIAVQAQANSDRSMVLNLLAQ
ncbi:flagellin [Oceanobacter mangrovi]|uniref:flagellin n=1 Tax=Oceanobacter mangrovi TaxID=2862510 RepID=UPI001C8DAB10|nr:flagellin [Oceanobacter mangrovi]